MGAGSERLRAHELAGPLADRAPKCALYFARHSFALQGSVADRARFCRFCDIFTCVT